MDVAVRRARVVAAAAWGLALVLFVVGLAVSWAASPAEGAWVPILLALMIGFPLAVAATIAWIVVEVRGITRAARPER